MSSPYFHYSQEMLDYLSIIYYLINIIPFNYIYTFGHMLIYFESLSIEHENIHVPTDFVWHSLIEFGQMLGEYLLYSQKVYLVKEFRSFTILINQIKTT